VSRRLHTERLSCEISLGMQFAHLAVPMSNMRYIGETLSTTRQCNPTTDSGVDDRWVATPAWHSWLSYGPSEGAMMAEKGFWGPDYPWDFITRRRSLAFVACPCPCPCRRTLEGTELRGLDSPGIKSLEVSDLKKPSARTEYTTGVLVWVRFMRHASFRCVVRDTLWLGDLPSVPTSCSSQIVGRP